MNSARPRTFPAALIIARSSYERRRSLGLSSEGGPEMQSTSDLRVRRPRSGAPPDSPGGGGAGPGRAHRARHHLHPDRAGRDPGRGRAERRGSRPGQGHPAARGPAVTGWSRSGCWRLGFAAYALWRLSEAAFGVTGEGNGAGPRLKSARPGGDLRGLRGADVRHHRGHRRQPVPPAAGPGSQGHAPARRPLAGRASSAWSWSSPASVLIIEGLRPRSCGLLETSRMSLKTRAVVKRLGMVGTTARGAIFALAGALVVEAADQRTSRPSRAASTRPC